MKKILLFAALSIASQFANANILTKKDTAVTWMGAPAQEQAAVVVSLGEVAGISKKSELRHVILCMRALALDSEGATLDIEGLFKACLPQVKKPGGQPMAEQSPVLVATASLEEARLLFEKVKKKDSEAMYALAMLIGLEAPKAQVDYDATEWPKYGGRYVFGRIALLQEAASLENKNAAAYLCKVASDPGAPARYRSNKDKWCSVQE